MISNVTHSCDLSSPNPSQNKENKTSETTNINVNCSVLSVQKFLFDCDNLQRSDVFFGLVVCHFYNPELDLFDKKQEKHYPTSTGVRLKYRCKGPQKASKSDRTRIEWKNKGWIEYFKLKGFREFRLKLTQKFKMEFTLFELQKMRQDLINQTHLRMITEDDFKLRQEIEKRIVSLETELKKPQLHGATEA